MGHLRFVYKLLHGSVSSVLELKDATTGECVVVSGSVTASTKAERRFSGGSALVPWTSHAHLFVGLGHASHGSLTTTLTYRGMPMVFDAAKNRAHFAPLLHFPV